MLLMALAKNGSTAVAATDRNAKRSAYSIKTCDRSWLRIFFSSSIIWTSSALNRAIRRGKYAVHRVGREKWPNGITKRKKEADQPLALSRRHLEGEPPTITSEPCPASACQHP